MTRTFATLLLVALGAGSEAWSQPSVEQARKVTTEEFLAVEPLLTTGLGDARTEIPILDSLDLASGSRLSRLPMGPRDGFLLARPGLYEQEFQSYCLHPGRYGPDGGKGLLHAPLKGAGASIFRALLRGSAQHPEVPRDDVQDLLWFVLVGAAGPELREGVASLLLGEEDLAELGRVARRRQQELMAKAPLLLARQEALLAGELGQRMQELGERQVEAAARMQRAMMEMDMEAVEQAGAEATEVADELEGLLLIWLQELAGYNLSFEERERAMVLAGEHEPGPGSRDVPRGRWSYHPAGFFIRYFSSRYRQTRVQVLLPDCLELERDAKQRIASLADGYGNRLQITYEESPAPLMIPNDPGVRGYAFRALRLQQRSGLAPEISLQEELRWDGKGWTFVGIPSGQGRVDVDSGRFADSVERYAWAQDHRDRLEALANEIGAQREELGRSASGACAARGGTALGLQDVVDLGQLVIALDSLVPLPSGVRPQAAPLTTMARMAWASAFHQWAETSSGSRQSGPQGEVEPAEFVPADGVAVPADTAKQRLGIGPVDPDSDKEIDCNALRYELEIAKLLLDAFEKVMPKGGESVDDYLQRIRDHVKGQMDGLRGRLKDKGIRGTPSKPFAPMGTDPVDLRIAPGGPRDDPRYEEDWSRYDELSESDFEQYIRDKYFANDPDEVWDSSRVHEQDHIDLGREEVERARQMGKEDWRQEFVDWVENPFLLRDAEIRAYKRQIEYLEDRLEEDC